MNNTFRSILATSALLVGLSAQGALAQDAVSYPRVVGTGQNHEIEYGPGPHGNIVGGGAVLTQTTGEGGVRISYLDNSQVQKGLPGLEPVLIEDGQNSSVVYLPTTQSPRG